MRAINVDLKLIQQIHNDSHHLRLYTDWPFKLKPTSLRILDVLFSLGVVQHYEQVTKPTPRLRIYLKYKQGQPAARLVLAQKPHDTNRYVTVHSLRKHVQRNGGNIILLSTHRGLLTHTECIAANVGGSVFGIAMI